MDPLTLATMAASALAPYLAKGAEEVAKSVFKDAYAKLKEAIAGKPEAEKSLEKVGTKTDLQPLLEQQFAQNQALQLAFARALEAAGHAPKGQLVGKIEAANVMVARYVGKLVIGADGQERPVPFAAPRPPDPFVGRSDAVDEIVERLMAGDASSGPLALTALDGGPGVGKTSLARAVAWDPRIENHFEDGVLWAELGPEGNVEAELDKWGALIGLDMVAYQDITARSQALQGWLRKQKALLIVDDVWDVEKARAFLVGGAGCRAVVTTRQKAIADELAAEDPTHVKPLKPKDGLDLLRQLAPKAVAEDEQAARGLAKALDGLPLGIELAGRVLRRHTRAGLNAAGVIEELADREKRLDATDDAKRSAKDETKRSLRAVIALSYHNLPSDDTRACFRALSLFGAKPLSFSLDAARAVWDAGDTTAEEVIIALVESGLVELEESRGQEDETVRYTQHATIADFAESELARSGAGDPIAERRHAFYVELARETPQDQWKSLLPEVQQLDRTFEWAVERSDGDRADALQIATNDFLNRQALWNTKVGWLRSCLKLATARGDRKRESYLLHEEGYVHYKRGEWEQALERYEQSRVIQEEIGDRGGLAVTLNNIGMIHFKRGEWEQALERYEQSRVIQEEIGDRAGLAVTLFNIAGLYEDRERYAEALPLLERAAEIDEQIGSPNLESDREALERVRRKVQEP